MRRDVSAIKYILFEDGELTDEAKKRLAESRATPDSEYIGLDLNTTGFLGTTIAE